LKKYKVLFDSIDDSKVRKIYETNFNDSETVFDSEISFNVFCKKVIQVWNKHVHEISSSAKFDYYRHQILSENEKTIATSWGGVVLDEVIVPRIKKFLVVDKSKYLSLEIHEEKEEKITIVSGVGLLLRKKLKKGELEAILLQTGDEVEFAPLIEHCVIGLENLLIYENSLDHKGMDQDLIFIYQPS